MRNDNKTGEPRNESRPNALTSIDLLCPAATYTHLDLFSGIGGFSLAARWLGWQTVAFVEKDEFCRKVLRKNFGNDIKIYDDIKQFSGESFRGTNIITGGFPCQPFSTAGKRQGKDDDRYLWDETLRVVAEAKPDWFVGENVAGIISLALDDVLSDLESEGYETVSFVLPACAVNAPHRRDRVWIIADSRCRSSRERGLLQQECIGFDVEQRKAKTSNKNGLPSLLRRNESEQHFGDSQKWRSQPPIRRISYGIPDRVDRLKCLGNSIVPQVAFEILSAIQAVDFQRAGT